MKILIFILSFFVMVSSYPADTSSAYPPQGLLNFKGLDDTSSPLEVEDGRATSLQNVKLSRAFELSKRYGYTLVNTRFHNAYSSSDQLPTVTGLFYAKLSSGTRYRMAVVGDRVYYDLSGVWTDITGSDAITYAANNQFVWVVGNDDIIFSNDTDPPFKFTGTGTVGVLDLSDLTAAVTTVKTLAWFKNYLILGNITEGGVDYPTRFRWSDVGTTETFDDDNYLDIAALGGQEINGVAELYDNLYFILTDSIWRCSLVGGEDIFVLSKVVDGIGGIAKNSVQTLNIGNQRQALVFLSKDKKIYVFDGTAVVDISVRIQDVMAGLRASRLQYAVSVDTGTSYYLAVTDGAADSTNDLLLELQYEIMEWTKHTNINANALAKVFDDTDLPEVWAGNYDDCVLQLDDSSVDSDVAGEVGGVASTVTFNIPGGSATGLQMLILDTAITSTLTGSIITLTGGTGIGEVKTVIWNTDTGIVVDSDFSDTPDSTTLFSVGAIDAQYYTKWFDLGLPMNRKLMGKVYFWTETTDDVTLSVSEALDFKSAVVNEEVLLKGTGGVWGTGLWGTALWGGESMTMKTVNLKGSGRFVRMKFSNAVIDERFDLTRYGLLFWTQDF